MLQPTARADSQIFNGDVTPIFGALRVVGCSHVKIPHLNNRQLVRAPTRKQAKILKDAELVDFTVNDDGLPRD